MVAPMATVALIDIDGTLVRTGGAGRRSLGQAFEEICGISNALEGISLGGMTDPLILRTVLEGHGRAMDEAICDAVLSRYLELLSGAVAESEGYEVMPGVQPLIAALEQDAKVALGLGTGNIEAGARTKLARADLSRPFAFGGFGSDAECRTELLRIGAERGARQLGLSLAQCRVVIVGDTPRDVIAAQELGAQCVAVATGGFSEAQLAASGPCTTVPTLEGADVLAMVRGT